MKNADKSKNTSETSKLGKRILILFVMVLIGYIVGYLIDTQNSILYGVVIAALLVEFWVLIETALTKNK